MSQYLIQIQLYFLCKSEDREQSIQITFTMLITIFYQHFQSGNDTIVFIVKCTYNTDQHAQTTFTSQNNLILLLHYLLTKKTWLFIIHTKKYQQMAQLHLSPIGQNCHRKYCSSKIDFFILEKCTAFSCFPFNQ